MTYPVPKDFGKSRLRAIPLMGAHTIDNRILRFLIPAPLCALLLMMLSRLSIVRFLPLLNRSPLRFCCLHSDAIPGAEYGDDAGGWKYPSDAQVPDVSFAVGDNLYQVCNDDITEL